MPVISRTGFVPVFEKLCCQRKAPVSANAARFNCPSTPPGKAARRVMPLWVDCRGRARQEAGASCERLKVGAKGAAPAVHSKRVAAFLKEDSTGVPSPATENSA